MLSILRFIASPKTTVFLLLLLAISIVFSIAGPNTLQTLRSAGFEKGLQSWPFLIGLGLLLLNQLFAVFVRIGRSRKKAPSVEEEEEDFIEWDTPQNEWETELDEKPKKKPSKPLPPPRAMGKASYGIDTVLPASNVKSLIETLGFTITSAEELGDEKEQIDARKGPSSAWYTLFIHLGAVVFLAGWLLSLSMYPLQKVSVYMGKNNKANLKKTVHPPMMSWLQKIGLTKDNSTTYPALDVSLVNMKQEFRSYQYFNHTYNKLTPKKNKLDVAQQSVDSLFMNLRKPTLKQANLERRVAFSASLVIGATKQPILLHQNQSIQHKGYNITLARAFTKATLDVDGKKVELTSGAMHKLSKTKSLKLLYTKHNSVNPTAGCLQVAVFETVKGKQTPTFEGCLQAGQKLPKSNIPVTLSSIQQGVRLHYRPRLGFLLILSGLLLFVFGFIGFWWPQRYTLSLEWNRTENKLQLEGTGYDVIPRELAHGISESLYFPASQIKSHQRQSPSSPSSPPVPTPPQRQTVANIQGQQSQAAVANVPAPNQRQTQLHGQPSQAPAPQGQTARQVKAQSPAPQRQTAQKRVPQAQQPKPTAQAPQKPAAQGQTARQVTNQPQAAQRQTAQKRVPQAQQPKPAAQRQTQAKAAAPQGQTAQKTVQKQTAQQVKTQSPAPQRQTAQKRIPQAQQPKQAPQAPQKPAAQGQTARQVTKQPAAQSTAGIGAFNQQVAPPKAKKSTTAAHGTSQPKTADISGTRNIYKRQKKKKISH